jgi:prepilin-type N-terminal cleavage/methylation domain-containing protein
MNLGKHNAARRGGFTLVEILVVIAIIGVLIALLVPVVISVMRLGPDTVCQTEINKLDVSVQNFQTYFKVNYFPSQLRLAEWYGAYTLIENGAPQDDQLDRDSVNFLQRLWPQLLSTDPATGTVRWQDPTIGIDWNGDGVLDKKTKFTLEGDQCLVFFLGGIPTTISGVPGVLGWSTNPRDPSFTPRNPAFKVGPNGQTTARVVPFFDFPATRLFLRNTAQVGLPGKVANPFLSFADPFRNPGVISPYIYFSNYGSRNGYNSPFNPRYVDAKGNLLGDCQSLVSYDHAGNQVQGVLPYFLSAPNKANPINPLMFPNSTGFQIISAGNDGRFGMGGVANPFNPWGPLVSNDPGFDDRCDFNSGSVVGAPAGS